MCVDDKLAEEKDEKKERGIQPWICMELSSSVREQFVE